MHSLQPGRRDEGGEEPGPQHPVEDRLVPSLDELPGGRPGRPYHRPVLLLRLGAPGFLSPLVQEAEEGVAAQEDAREEACGHQSADGRLSRSGCSGDDEQTGHDVLSTCPLPQDQRSSVDVTACGNRHAEQVHRGDVTLVVEPGVGLDAQREAAGVSARAVAVRDNLPAVPALADKLVGIQQALGEAGASLLVARRGPLVLGFCVLVPQGSALEIRYLASDPAAWGSGVGRALLEGVRSKARREAVERVELWVIADNTRAVALYEGSGWTATDRVEERGSAGRPERLYVRWFA